jgi:hypothetical protein
MMSLNTTRVVKYNTSSLGLISTNKTTALTQIHTMKHQIKENVSGVKTFCLLPLLATELPSFRCPFEIEISNRVILKY